MIWENYSKFKIIGRGERERIKNDGGRINLKLDAKCEMFKEAREANNERVFMCWKATTRAEDLWRVKVLRWMVMKKRGKEIFE